MSVATIPAGMKVWNGGEQAPDDWDGGPVLCRDGAVLQPTEEAWDSDEDAWDYVAYTPTPTSETDQLGGVGV